MGIVPPELALLKLLDVLVAEVDPAFVVVDFALELVTVATIVLVVLLLVVVTPTPLVVATFPLLATLKIAISCATNVALTLVPDPEAPVYASVHE